MPKRVSRSSDIVPADQQIRIGICGAGNIVETHLRALERTEGMRATAISSRTKKSSRKLARRFGVPLATDDHRATIESPDVDVVLVAAPNYQHAPLALAALAVGKHVIIEKPLAVTLAEGKSMVAAARRAGRHLFYAEQLPLAPKSAVVAAAAQAGELGDLHLVRQVERHAGPYSPWFFQRETAGGGVMMDLGCHSISVILDIMGERRIERVTGLTRTYKHTHGDVEDFSLVEMQFADGTLGVAENSWCYLGGFESVTEIFGSRGNLRADIGKGSGVTVYVEGGQMGRRSGAGGWHRPQYDDLLENGYLAQFAAIQRTLRHGDAAPQTGEDGLRVLRIMLAAYRSAQRGGAPVRVSI